MSTVTFDGGVVNLKTSILTSAVGVEVNHGFGGRHDEGRRMSVITVKSESLLMDSADLLEVEINRVGAARRS